MTAEPFSTFDDPDDARAAAAIVGYMHEDHRGPTSQSQIDQAVFYSFADDYKLGKLLDEMVAKRFLVQGKSFVYELTDLGAAWYIWGKDDTHP